MPGLLDLLCVTLGWGAGMGQAMSGAPPSAHTASLLISSSGVLRVSGACFLGPTLQA